MKETIQPVEVELLLVKAKHIHPSSVIPLRNHEYGLTESVKTVGVQEPLIVRPLASNPHEYETINGQGRRDALDPEQEVYVNVRRAKDAEAFKIAAATSKMTRRSTCENAEFYSKYIEIVKQEMGEKGALTRVAKETQLSESELSQYVAINKLFLKLNVLGDEAHFPKLETMGINKLYKLSEILENPKLLQVARELEEKADNITLENINRMVEDLQPNKIDELLGLLDDDAPTTALQVSLEKASEMEARFKDLKEKITAMAEEASTIMQSLEIEELPSEEPTLNILQKMSVCFRRFHYYAKKLKMQGGKCPKTE